MKVEHGGKLFFQFFSIFFEQADATYSEHDLRAQQRIPFNKVDPRMTKRMSSRAIVGRLCQTPDRRDLGVSQSGAAGTPATQTGRPQAE
jgi:hypothetical protein